MKKKNLNAALLLFLLILILAAVLLISPHRKKIAVSLSGYQVNMFDSSQQNSVEIHIEGELTYGFFSPKHFKGHIGIEGYEITSDDSYITDIQFTDNCGYLAYLKVDSGNVKGESLGYICTDNFDSVLILLYDENSPYASKCHTYICAPAETIDDACNIANRLSKNTWMDDIDWSPMMD